MLCKVESMMMILFSTSLAYLSLPSSGVFTVLLCSYPTNNCNNRFGTNLVSD